MRRPTPVRVLATATSFALLTACGALLDLPPLEEITGNGDGSAAPESSGGEGGGLDGATTLDGGPDTSTTLDAGPDGPRGKIVFVTGRTEDGALGGLAGGDAICNAEAAAAGLTGVFLSYLHAGGGDPGHPGRRLVTDAGWSLVDGVSAFAGNPHDFLPKVAIDLAPDAGRLAAGERVWSGITSAPSSTCGAGGADVWTTTTPAIQGGGWGDPKIVNNANWHTHGANKVDCGERLHLYCFEQ